MNMITSVQTVLWTKYFDFKTRATRSEYWWYTLFIWIASMVIQAPYFFYWDEVMAAPIEDPFVLLPVEVINVIFGLLTIIPGISVSVRRLHDVGRSGWWLLLWFLPIIGWIPLIYWTCKASTDDNQWGENPLA